MEIVALVVSATGIAGRGASQELVNFRRPRAWPFAPPGRRRFGRQASGRRALLDPSSVGNAVSQLKPTHVYLTAWSRRPTEEENIKVNAGIVRTVLDAVAPARASSMSPLSLA